MDLGAAVVGFVSLGLQVSQNIITYYGGWRNSREDVDDICNSVGEMHQMLKILENAVKRRSLNGCNETALFKYKLQRCEISMHRLDGKVKKFKDNTATGGFLARARSEWERVKYPLKESTILKLRDLLQEQKLDLVLILNVLDIDASSVESGTLTQNMSQLSCDVSKIEAQVGETKNILNSSVQDLKRKEVLGWICSQDQSLLYQSRKSRRHPGTCQWFLQGREYLQWRSKGSLLWVKGEVGCGKSILCSAVVEHLQWYCTTQSNNILLYFFFSFADAHLSNPILCLSSLLRQICVDERILRDVEKLHEKFNGSTAPRPLQYHDIELAVDSAIASLARSKEIYIVLDALDELPNDADEFQRSRVLSWIMKTSTCYRHVHILFTSRSSSSRDIEDFADSIPSIGIVTIDAMSNHNDMFSYLEAEFKKSRVLCKMPVESLSTTFNDMIKLSDGMFQWIHLQMVELSKLPTLRLKDIDRILNSIPPSLDDTQNGTWTLTDLDHFPLLEYACRYWFEHMKLAGTKDQMRLASLASELLKSGEKWQYTTMVYNHMMPDTPFSCAHLRWTLLSPLGWATVLGLESVVHLLLSQRSGDLHLIQDIKLERRKCFQIKKPCQECLYVRLREPISGTVLMKAVEFGHTSIIQLLIDNGADINSSGELGATALSIACTRGNYDLVKYLLNLGASPSHGLPYAIREGSLSICQLLLEAGAVADEQIQEETPLMVAASLDDHDICQVLLDFGADVNQLIKTDDSVVRDPDYATDALSAATMLGNIQTVELLLSNGAHIRGSALAYSLSGLEDGPRDSHREICNILIQHGADMNPDLGGFYNTPLAMALYNCWWDIARCMIRKGARVDPSDPTCLSAGNILVEAVSSVEMTREILGIGVDADSPIAAVYSWAWERHDDAENFTTALQAAAYYGHVDTMNLLLENGANPNILGPPYGTLSLSPFAGVCYDTKNIWPESQGNTEKERERTYDLNVRDKLAQTYKILQERGASNLVPWFSQNYDAFCEYRGGIKYRSIKTGIVEPESIDEEASAVLSR
ncbi:uncharacterized protein N7511_003030 [Penicillium nucicola]|uniref:uncharacterized protein n=1 Tax=Penicillium nucicola TaxID=1850975 RepID=UPI002545BAA8|nr:uncharacterized protein N7511_003030 [Penicillium nucicola]KAJ5770979.1 hypothetical protein N7511_003030 [Penicillium nucicola]